MKTRLAKTEEARLRAAIAPHAYHDSLDCTRYPVPSARDAAGPDASPERIRAAYAEIHEAWQAAAAERMAVVIDAILAANLGYAVERRDPKGATLRHAARGDSIVIDGRRCRSVLLDEIDEATKKRGAASFSRFVAEVDR